MQHHVLTCAEMAAAERLAIEGGTDSYSLMRNAGTAVASEVIARWPTGDIAVLCGPGNNGGDGFVIAETLRHAGRLVEVYELPAANGESEDRKRARTSYNGTVRPLKDAEHASPDIMVDALFGAGLSRPLNSELERLATRAWSNVVAVDFPSGVNGDIGVIGPSFRADLTVTFAALKPAHLLAESRLLCGDVTIADIGVSVDMIGNLHPNLSQNSREVWGDDLPWPGLLTHKHQRGHLMCVTGGPSQTGAARLAARAGLRVGAGLVTLLSPPAALLVNAIHSTAIMVRSFDSPAMLAEQAETAACVVIGPAAGLGEGTRTHVQTLLAGDAPCVLDADALTVFADVPDQLFAALRPGDVLTPHPGEFGRLFPDIHDAACNRIDKVRRAAERAGCIVLLKGADTVIAAPDGRAVINTHASPWLATAGSGDVLAGVIGGWRAQGMDSFSAAAAGTWLHGDLGQRGGPGLIAEDLIEIIPEALSELADINRSD